MAPSPPIRSNPNVVFIIGDAQDIQFDKMGNPIKNANGCTTFNANVFRYTGTTWENVVCDGANGTAPHADSRFMTFDADGNLLQANDGGIARLVSPNNPTMRRWVAVDGNIRSAEFHSIAYDPLSNIIFGGTQDNGTPVHWCAGSITWNQLIGADGGVVAIDANQSQSRRNVNPVQQFSDIWLFQSIDLGRLKHHARLRAGRARHYGGSGSWEDALEFRSQYKFRSTFRTQCG